jgi:hypothetical protein
VNRRQIAIHVPVRQPSAPRFEVLQLSLSQAFALRPVAAPAAASMLVARAALLVPGSEPAVGSEADFESEPAAGSEADFESESVAGSEAPFGSVPVFALESAADSFAR